MTDDLDPAVDTVDLLTRVQLAAQDYLASLRHRPVRDLAAEKALAGLEFELPSAGLGGDAAIDRMLEIAVPGAIASTGGRFFHFIVGGCTPAALAGDWITSLLDQNAGAWVTSPLATRLETVVLAWLKDLFGLPGWGGVLVTGGTAANLVGLCSARQWWADRVGIDVTARGLHDTQRLVVVSGGYVHPSVHKALQIMGLGTDSVRVCAKDPAGRVDLDAIAETLARTGPAVIVATAGDVNTGDFDPIDQLADLAERYGAWLHVDAACGAFAALSPDTAPLLNGLARAHSVAADGHKWLNVPYESGFAFVRDGDLLRASFQAPDAGYLKGSTDPHTNFGSLGPEGSRRARALPIWATLAAYGRDGYRRMVERHLELARYLGERVQQAPDMELLADVTLNIVCFRFRPAGLSESALNGINAALGIALLSDGRVYAGTTTYCGRTALRPSIVSWRTTKDDIDLFLDVVRELADELMG
ncbi:aspartate aminotransferase family protein [Actinocrispum sp. NPDC049592]|uniref:pyridoxal phosphate-dependent decarboxylase family protein n=1 Tax=Actinocrispum sp. NPDC049592 TaxID=3154835 RepID=UPI0034499957